MISFRFYLVSLVAVFLALGLGILSGTTVINRGLVTQLENNTEEAQRQVAEARAQLDVWSAFGSELRPLFIQDRLLGRSMVMVMQLRGTDPDAVSAVRDALEEAGADIVTLLSVTERMAVHAADERLELAQALDADADEDAASLKDQAAQQLAEELAFGVPDDGVLSRLIEEGFLRVEQAPQDAELGAALRVADGLVVIGGSEAVPPAPQPEGFLVPFVAAVAEDGIPVAAAETLDSRFDFVEILRGDGAVADRIVTLDNSDTVPGQIGLVMALDDLLDTGASGHYGVKDGATDVIPPPPT